MTMNPFIQFATDPVGTLAWLGYGLLLLGIVLMSSWWSMRMIARLWVQYTNNKHTDKWWSGPLDIGVVPPPGWSLRATGVLFVWAIGVWAVSALFWMGGG